MKETGIIMSGNHPRLILDELKTMTRRTWGLEEINKAPDTWEYVWDSICQQHRFYDKYYKDAPPIIVKCPYGQVGDRLWVRETWHSIEHPTDKDSEFVTYKATAHPHILKNVKWKPSLFMPHWASRITLEITELRAERLQKIFNSNEHDKNSDIYAEGVEYMPPYAVGIFGYNIFATFRAYWDSLNLKKGYGWCKNPWVWPIGFKAVK